MNFTKERAFELIDQEIEFAKGTGMPQFVMGLQQAKKVIELEFERQKKEQCSDCERQERNPGLSVCGGCYHRRITGNH